MCRADQLKHDVSAASSIIIELLPRYEGENLIVALTVYDDDGSSLTYDCHWERKTLQPAVPFP